MDCGKEVRHAGSRCRKCYAKTQKTGKMYPCAQCESPVYKTEGHLRCAKRTKGVFCDRVCFSLFYHGKNNPQYKHGNSYNPYPKEFRRIRRSVLKRDGIKCFLCGTEKAPIRPGHVRTNLDVHHIDWDKENNDITNLVTLCLKCHCDQAGTMDQVIERSGILSRKLCEKYGYQKPSTTCQSRGTTTTLPDRS
jgi:hypothetical protein